ncbi:MAG: group II intron reverse transcriptase/maturase, partial [Planctomycetes bacterium]|nr:group II intron reverse transcriptase/maturase [Planctomycetota bacterium]
ALEEVQRWTQAEGLTLHPTKTKLVNLSEPGGFDFLGYHFETPTKHWPREKSREKLKDSVREKTKRTRGVSLSCIIQDLNRSLEGWFEYFRHSYYTTFEPLDGWIRMRLRSILRKRIGLRGKGRGADHQRWPNAFFRDAGLFSLTAAHAALGQSSPR